MLIRACVLAIARVCVIAYIVRLAGTWARSTVPQSTWPVFVVCRWERTYNIMLYINEGLPDIC